MSVQNEIDLQNLVAEYKTIIAMKTNFNIAVTNIRAEAEAIKLMPLYDTEMSAEEKADIENILTVTDGLHL